jgi:hypothetical protein
LRYNLLFLGAKLSVTFFQKNGVTTGVKKPMAWLKEQEIRWVEQRVLEREAIERDRYDENGKPKPEIQRRRAEDDKTGEFDKIDYLAWLYHVRDKLSFQKTGDQLFSGDQTPEGRKVKAHRAWNRVEWEFRRGSLKRKRKH